MKLWNKANFLIKPGFYAAIAIAILYFPAIWVISWVAAITIHELFHYIVLRLCKISVHTVDIGVNGIKMETEATSGFIEFICAAAGPLGSLLIVFLYKQLPILAVCGLFHLCYNLLPVYPFDGGRILHGFFTGFWGEEKGSGLSNITELVFMGFILTGSIIVCLFEKDKYFLILPAIIIIFFAKAKFTCKQREQRVQ